MRLHQTSELIIDTSEEDQFFNLNIDVTFNKAPCQILGLDIVDVTGVHMVDIAGTLHKNVLDENGNVLRNIDALAQVIPD